MAANKKSKTVGHAQEVDYVYLEFKKNFCSKRGKSITGRKGDVKRVHKFDLDKKWIDDQDEESPCRLVKRPKDFGDEKPLDQDGETAEGPGED